MIDDVDRNSPSRHERDDRGQGTRGTPCQAAYAVAAGAAVAETCAKSDQQSRHRKDPKRRWRWAARTRDVGRHSKDSSNGVTPGGRYGTQRITPRPARRSRRSSTI
jgi:hypothetical protein